MDSSVKYEKFTVSQDEQTDKKLKSYKKSKNCLIIAFLVVSIVAVAAALVAIGVGVGVSVSQTSEATDVKVLTLDQEKLEGEYYGSDGVGIHFVSIANETDLYILITAIEDGEVIFMITHPRESSMTMMTVNNHTNFLVMDDKQSNKTGQTSYVIPEQYLNMVKTMMNEHQTDMPVDMLELMDTTTVMEAQHTSLQKLTNRAEAILIVSAAEALGGLGIEGSQYPHVMYFYTLALRLSGAKEDHDGSANKRDDSEYGLRRYARQKRSCYGEEYCTTGRCPYRGYSDNGRECFGMCGYGCNCWRIVCGDCCVHQGCYEHDGCCARRGFWSIPCFSVYRFSCTNFDC